MRCSSGSTAPFMKGRRGDVSKQFLGEGLLNSEGALHQRQRHLMQPAFHRQRLAQYATVMTTYSRAAAASRGRTGTRWILPPP